MEEKTKERLFVFQNKNMITGKKSCLKKNVVLFHLLYENA